MAGISVPIEFVASFDQAVKGLSQFGDEVNSKVGSIESSFGTLKLAVEALGIAFVGEKISQGLEAVIEKGSESEQAINQLSLALKASGDFSQQNVSVFQALAESLSQTTKYTEDQILSQVRLAKQFNTTNAEAAKLITAATNLAAATGEDLGTAVQQLGQTLEGQIGRFGRLIPSVQLLSAEQLRAGAAIDVVAARFKGFAEGELNTFQGSLDEVSKSFQELEKNFGLPIVKSQELRAIFVAIKLGIDSMTEGIKANQGAIASFVSSGVLIAVEAIGVLAQAFKILNELVYTDVALIGDAGKILLSLKSGDFTGIKNAFSDAKDTVATFFKVLNGESTGNAAGNTFFDRVTNSASTLSNKIQDITASQKDLGVVSGAVATNFDSQVNKVQRFDLSIKGKILALEEELKKVGETPIESLTKKYDLEIKLINDAFKLGYYNDQKRRELDYKSGLKYNTELYNALAAQVQKIFANPFQNLINPVPQAIGSLGISAQGQQGLASGLGAAGGILQGSSGAANLITSIATSFATKLLGPVGQVLGPILQQLEKGPDAVKAMVDDFAKSLPIIVTNIVKAVPAFITELVKETPVIIQGFIDALPDITNALVAAAPDIIAAQVEAAPRIVAAIVTKLPGALLKSLEGVFTNAAGSFTGKLVSGAGQFIGKILEGAGQFIQKLLDGISHPFGKSGSLLNFSGGGFGLGGNQGLLGGGIISGILQQVPGGGTSHTLHINMNVGRQQLATQIIDLKRYGYRLEPV